MTGRAGSAESVSWRVKQGVHGPRRFPLMRIAANTAMKLTRQRRPVAGGACSEVGWPAAQVPVQAAYFRPLGCLKFYQIRSNKHGLAKCSE